jgi:uncharacterized protein with HEPN domain
MKDPLVYVEHIRDALADVQRYTRDGREAFLGSSLVQDAVARKLEVVGEAARNLPQTFRDRWPGVPWRDMVDLRNVLIHEYFRLNLRRIWDIVEQELPGLLAQMQAILEAEGGELPGSTAPESL